MRRILLVLDNFEQILPEGALVASLIAESPSLVILITSRAVLHVYGEQSYLLSPLEMPNSRDRGVAAGA